MPFSRIWLNCDVLKNGRSVKYKCQFIYLNKNQPVCILDMNISVFEINISFKSFMTAVVNILSIIEARHIYMGPSPLFWKCARVKFYAKYLLCISFMCATINVETFVHQNQFRKTGLQFTKQLNLTNLSFCTNNSFQ